MPRNREAAAPAPPSHPVDPGSAPIPAPTDKISVPGYDAQGGLDLVRFAQALSGSSNLDELERRFIAGFGRLMAVPMYALYIFDPQAGPPGRVVSSNVSDIFLARYERVGRDEDPMHEQVLATGNAAYNLAIMSDAEWLETTVYREIKRIHDIRHVVEAPVITSQAVVGTLHFGTSDPSRGFTRREIELASAVGRIAGTAIKAIRFAGDLERERDQALAALELSGTAVVLADPAALTLVPNDAAREILAKVDGGEDCLHRVMARPFGDDRFSRRVEVELCSGGTGILRAHSTTAPGDSGRLITVLELERSELELAAGPIAALAPREREVAKLIVEDLSDREIAEELHLSRHTVSEYVKRIYRKLDVGSRVALTRLLLGPASRHG